MQIVAECSNNHQGDMNLAKKMIEIAAEADADWVKFQTYKTEKLVGLDDKTLQYLKKAELNFDQHCELKEHCIACGIWFLSTPFDIESVELLKILGQDVYKVPSGQITNFEYLEAFPKSARDKIDDTNLGYIILSTGMSNLREIKEALNHISYRGATLLHCTSAYPTPFEDVNLRAMETLGDVFNLPVGLSDHTLGIEIPIAACAMGAEMLEKHFTLDRSMEGPDQKMSIEPDELRLMIKSIRNVEKAMGDGYKLPTPSEQPNLCRRT
jgi:sialic acid synthase SpsE